MYQDEAGDSAVRAPGTQTVLLQLTKGEDNFSSGALFGPDLWPSSRPGGDEVVVGDLVQQLAVLLLGARAHLVQAHVLPQCVNMLLPVVRVVAHPGDESLAEVCLSE